MNANWTDTPDRGDGYYWVRNLSWLGDSTIVRIETERNVEPDDTPNLYGTLPGDERDYNIRYERDARYLFIGTSAPPDPDGPAAPPTRDDEPMDDDDWRDEDFADEPRDVQDGPGGADATGTDGPARHHVFVYGTLLDGFGNHRRFLAPGIATGAVRFVRRTITCQGWTMIDMGGFPAVINEPRDDRNPIVGEVYEVDDATLADLDRLEGHPNFYLRQPVTLWDGSDAWMYLISPTKVGHEPTIPDGDYRAFVAARSAS